MAIGTIASGESGLSSRNKINQSFSFIDNVEQNLLVERLYDGQSALASQEPSALDTPLEIQFGPVFGDASSPVQTLARGGNSEASILQINETGTYRIKSLVQFGKSVAFPTAILNFRALINGVQAGFSVSKTLGAFDVNQNFVDEAWLTLPAGLQITYEVIRDSGGANAGGCIAGVTSGSTGWNAAPSAAVRVERWASAI